jgi:hypothetical protein
MIKNVTSNKLVSTVDKALIRKAKWNRSLKCLTRKILRCFLIEILLDPEFK